MTPVIFPTPCAPWYTSAMRWFHEVVYEPGLLKIFRLFSLSVSLFFFLFYGFPTPTYEVLGTYRMMLAIMGLSYGVLFLYLTISHVRRWMKNFFLPVAVLASMFIPIGFINWAPQTVSLHTYPGLAFQPINSWTVTILMLFPLVITAWQYSFNIVLLFFAGLGIIDPIISLLIYDQGGEGLYMIIYASAVRIIAFTAIGYIITELMKNQRKKQEDLSRANTKLKEYARQTRELAVIRERNRLASELHDVLAHTLSGLAVHLEAIDSVIPKEQQQLRHEIQRALESAREGLKETRRAMHDLRAEPLESFGFIQAIEQMVRQYRLRGEIDVDLQLRKCPRQLSASVEQNVYRILQECLENVVHHAQAERVMIHCDTSEASRFRIIVEDNGIGFNPEAVDRSTHFGLVSIRERAERMGGSCSVISPAADGRGARITVAIPMENSHDTHYDM